MTSDLKSTEKLSDVSDQASFLEQIATDDAIRTTLSKIERAPPEFDGLHCVDCGEEILFARLQTGAFRDVRCQVRAEDRKRLYKKG